MKNKKNTVKPILYEKYLKEKQPETVTTETTNERAFVSGGQLLKNFFVTVLIIGIFFLSSIGMIALLNEQTRQLLMQLC